MGPRTGEVIHARPVVGSRCGISWARTRRHGARARHGALAEVSRRRPEYADELAGRNPGLADQPMGHLHTTVTLTPVPAVAASALITATATKDMGPDGG